MNTTIIQKGLDGASWKDIRVEQGLGGSILLWQGQDLVHIHRTRISDVSKTLDPNTVSCSDLERIGWACVKYISNIKTQNPQALIHQDHIKEYISLENGDITIEEFIPHPDYKPLGKKEEQATQIEFVYTDSLDMIAKERKRQVLEEHFDSDLDDTYTRGQLADAAGCYAMTAEARSSYQSLSQQHGWYPRWWPKSWQVSWWKPSPPTPQGRLKELAKAGALIVAEMDRIKRQLKRIPAAKDLDDIAKGIIDKM